MAIKEIIVFVYLPGEPVAVPAGIFTHDSDLRVGNFAYGHRYLERDNVIPVDPISLKLGTLPEAVTTNAGLYGAFRDASPDYWGRLVIAAEQKTVSENISEIDFLLGANATRVGNLDFRDNPDSPEPKLEPPAFNQLSNIIRAVENIEAGKTAEEHILHLLRQGSSMGGARPKCTVEWDDSLWIAKFPAKGDTVNIPGIEYATMKLAKRCGIDVPKVRVKSIAGKDVFLIQRFDRERAAAGWLRKGFISALSLMRLDEKERLKWSYLSIAAFMRQYCSTQDISQLFRRIIFNILVRNTDDHPRNHGFLVTENGLSLSPAYDIVPELTPIGVCTGFNLAMTVGKTGREGTLENAMSSCEQFGLSGQRAKEILGQMIETAHNWENFFVELGVMEREIKLLAPSFERCREVIK